MKRRSFMHKAVLFSVGVTLAVVGTAGAAGAPEGEPPPGRPNAEPQDADDEELRALAAELRRLKLEIGIPDVEYKSFAGMGPAASKVYFVPRGLSLGGYGELVYRNRLDEGAVDDTDLLRVILYTGYRFSDRIVFNAEIEFEHATELGVEFAYLDFIFADALRLRAGNVLVPVGFINETHEPAFFHGVLRPDFDRNLIPSTWNDNGIGVFGDLGRVRYKAYLLNGLRGLGKRACVTDDQGTVDPADDVEECTTEGGFAAGSWLRNGRQRGAQAVAESFAGVVALGYEHELFTVGGSLYGGDSGQGTEFEGDTIGGRVLLGEAHAGFSWGGLTMRAIGAVGTLDEAGEISRYQGRAIGSRVQGGYVEAAYDVMRLVAPGEEAALFAFTRYEAMDLHARVPAGFVRDPGLDTRTLTVGVTYKPVPTVVAKGDYQRRTSARAGAEANDQVNLGIGFVF